MYLGIVMVYDAATGSVGPGAGHVHCRLAWAPHARAQWRWVDPGGLTGAEFIPAGPPGAFDSHVCFAAHQPVRVADGSARVYYMGGNGPHSGLRNSSFALATLRPDRFAGLGGDAGTVTTRALLVTSASLIATVDVRRGGGSVVFGVVGGGAALARSAPVMSNCTDCAIAWPRAAGGLASFVGRNVSFTVTVDCAVLYTLGFA